MAALILAGSCAPMSMAARTDSLPNLHRVHNYLYRGGAPDQYGVEKLHGMHVGVIIDLRSPNDLTAAEKGTAERLGMQYLNIPMDNKTPTLDQVTKFLQTVENGQPQRNMDYIPSVYVHGNNGKDDTGAMIAIWRVTHEGWTFDEAYREMLRYGFNPQLTALKQCVQDWADKSKHH